MGRRQIHVRIRRRRWAVQHAEQPEPVSSHDEREAAVRAANALAEKHDADVVVFGLDDQPLTRDEAAGG